MKAKARVCLHVPSVVLYQPLLVEHLTQPINAPNDKIIDQKLCYRERAQRSSFFIFRETFLSSEDGEKENILERPVSTA